MKTNLEPNKVRRIPTPVVTRVSILGRPIAQGIVACSLRARASIVRLLVSGIVASGLFVAFATDAIAQVAEITQILDAAATISATNRALAARAGQDYQTKTLEAVRRSCAARGVTRLDEVAPASVQSDAGPKAPAPLLHLEFAGKLALPSPALAQPDGGAAASAVGPPATAAAPTPTNATPPAALLLPASIARVDKATEVEAAPLGVVLRSGQLRTTGALAIARDLVGTIEIDAVAVAPAHLLLGWSDAANAPRLRRNNARVEVTGDGQVHTYVIDAADALMRGLASDASVRRFFFATKGDAAIELRALRVLPRSQRFAAKAWTNTHETRGDALRSVLSMRPATALTWDVDVPSDSPVFETGLAVITGDGVLEFEVAVQDAETRTVLRKRLVRSAPWEDLSVDLTPWKSKRVRFSLAVRGTRDAVGLWSSPLIRPRFGAERTEPFVVILEDAMRADRLSVYGGPVATPAHERLAASGVAFDRAFAQATQTRSSVPSLMTSLMPSTTGAWDFSDSLSERFVTLAEALRACGFATASFVQNGNAGVYAGLAQGFDVVVGEEHAGARSADLLSDTSPLAKWIERQQGRPYFAYVHLLDPHGPYDPADRPDLAASSSADELLRDKTLDAEWIARPTAGTRRTLYDREIAANDAAIGRFLDRMEARGDLAKAVLAVIADHGEFLGEHGGLWRHHPPAYIEVAQVPFLLQAPGTIARHIQDPVALLDLMPTLLELANVDASSVMMHGRSLVPMLKGNAAPPRAIPADEMALARGERRSSGCGSFATASSLWLLSCTRDQDYSPARLLPEPSRGPQPLRILDLSPTNLGAERQTGSFSHSILEGVGRRALASMQSDGIDAWRRMTKDANDTVATDPAAADRLRALGYAQ